MKKTRMTLQKEVILRTVKTMNNHPTAEMVYNAINEDHPTISRATVFRVLNQLAENELIQKITLPYGADCFDFNISHHYHIKCKICGCVDDIVADSIEDPCDKITDNHGYKILDYNIAFIGICPDCQKLKIPVSC